MSSTVLLYQHSGSANHGCEALASTINDILKKSIPNLHVVVSSSHPEQDKLYQLNVDCLVKSDIRLLKRFSFYWFVYNINKFLLKSQFLEEKLLVDKSCESLSKDVALYIAIGGDNYCYDKGKMFYPTDRRLKKLGKKLILIGCSIEPDDLPGELANHLKHFDLIITRETLTKNALEQNGIRRLKLIPDSAFTLCRELLPLPENWKEGNTIGINFSPMSLDYAKDADLAINNFYNLCDYIFKNTDSNIALIPHVRSMNYDDVATMRKILGRYEVNNRIMLIDDLNHTAAQLKGFISRCRMFIGARTHATIAAYSTCVPTLVLGYSVKAKGIATDIFGTYENYVLPVQDLKRADDLVNAFKWLMQNEDKIRNHLQQFMPGYIEKAWQAGEEVKKMIEDTMP